MHGDKWRLALRNEEWEFTSEEELQTVQKILMELKRKYGRVSRF